MEFLIGQVRIPFISQVRSCESVRVVGECCKRCSEQCFPFVPALSNAMMFPF